MSSSALVEAPGVDEHLALRAKAELELRRRRRRARPIRDYVDAATRGRFEWYRHNQELNEALEQVLAGEIKRLMVFEPPRHGKSEQISRLLPGKWLERYPDQWVGITSYGDILASGLSAKARDYYVEAGNRLHAKMQAASHWATTEGGGCWAAGVGGAITGKGAHLAIIDDPVRNRQDADSQTRRDVLTEWFTSTLRTRLEPDAALIVVLTRWHERDLAGWLIDQEAASANPQQWTIVDLPARAEPERPEYPGSCIIWPDWRQPGEALCPERYDDVALREIESSVGPRDWASLYQQRPRPREGGFFRYSWFEDHMVDARPANARWIRYWDTAGTEGDGDYTVGALLGRTPDGLIWVADVVRGQWSPGHRDQVIRATAEKDGRSVQIRLEQEAGVGGKDRSRGTIAALAGFTARAVPVTGSKENRADPLAAQCEAGNVRVVRGPWVHSFLEELVAFPNGAHDDQVDAASGAFNELAQVNGMSSHRVEF
jgi:predicted phage terminase large subunit-like protein